MWCSVTKWKDQVPFSFLSIRFGAVTPFFSHFIIIRICARVERKERKNERGGMQTRPKAVLDNVTHTHTYSLSFSHTCTHTFSLLHKFTHTHTQTPYKMWPFILFSRLIVWSIDITDLKSTFRELIRRQILKLFFSNWKCL